MPKWYVKVMNYYYSWIKWNQKYVKNKIQEVDGGRKDYKVDCNQSEFKDWEISW